MIDSTDLLGYAGVATLVYTYIRTQLRRDYVKGLSYSLLNLLGAALLVISLCFNWNAPALISNAVWVVVSGYGVYRCLKYKFSEKRIISKTV